MHAQRVPVLEVGGTHVSAALIDTGEWAIVPSTLTRQALDSELSAQALHVA